MRAYRWLKRILTGVLAGAWRPAPNRLALVQIVLGIISEETATVCIGCEGFNPVVIAPDTDGTVREAYHAENIDRL